MFVVKNSKSMNQMAFNNTSSTKETYPYLTVSNLNQKNPIKNTLNRFYESADNRLKSKPPIYYLRKVSKPYKYELRSVPMGYCNYSTEEIFTQRLNNYIKKEKKKGKNFSVEIINNTMKDVYKPKGLSYQEFLIKNPNFDKPNILSSKPEQKLRKLLTFNEIKNKNLLSTITLKHEEKEIPEENINNNNKIYFPKMIFKRNNESLYQSQDSDIFNLKTENNNLFREKTGEKYLIKNKILNYKDKVYITNESNTSWAPHISKNPSHSGYSSVKYNIISPNVKSTSQTKEEIEIGNKGNNKLKSMSEFIDLCRVSAPNINSQFINSLKENKGFFRKKNNLGYNFLDMHKNYKEIISKPFS